MKSSANTGRKASRRKAARRPPEEAGSAKEVVKLRALRCLHVWKRVTGSTPLLRSGAHGVGHSAQISDVAWFVGSHRSRCNPLGTGAFRPLLIDFRNLFDRVFHARSGNLLSLDRRGFLGERNSDLGTEIVD